MPCVWLKLTEQLRSAVNPHFFLRGHGNGHPKPVRIPVRPIQLVLEACLYAALPRNSLIREEQKEGHANHQPSDTGKASEAFLANFCMSFCGDPKPSMETTKTRRDPSSEFLSSGSAQVSSLPSLFLEPLFLRCVFVFFLRGNPQGKPRTQCWVGFDRETKRTTSFLVRPRKGKPS